eukprot:TRINITY_DN56503_c0_g1_i1.p1 TRINITY_DN56503_c0_g1~~TRINITY_DN56503_c0_g1_i1.p1  ORF type:complete len:446 (+),score=109.54 TRINITY_DN56503_c0_g1_i1:98-1339(+)
MLPLRALSSGVFAPLTAAAHAAAAPGAAAAGAAGALAAATGVAGFVGSHPVAALLLAYAQCTHHPGAERAMQLAMQLPFAGQWRLSVRRLPPPLWALLWAAAPETLTIFDAWSLFGSSSPLAAVGLTLAALRRLLHYWARKMRQRATLSATIRSHAGHMARGLVRALLLAAAALAMQRQRHLSLLLHWTARLQLICSAAGGALGIASLADYARRCILHWRVHLGDATARRHLRHLDRESRRAQDRSPFVYMPPAPGDDFSPGDTVIITVREQLAEVACRVRDADGQRPGTWYAVRVPQPDQTVRLRVYPVDRLRRCTAHVPDHCIQEDAFTRSQSGALRNAGGEAVELYAGATADDSCVVCYDEAQEVLFEPCRHLCACCTCARRLERCPMCREPIENRLRVPKVDLTSDCAD